MQRAFFTVLGIVLLVLFLSFHRERRLEEGEWWTVVEVGFPKPWLVYESGYVVDRWEADFTPSAAFGVMAVAAFYCRSLCPRYRSPKP